MKKITITVDDMTLANLEIGITKGGCIYVDYVFGSMERNSSFV